MAPKPQRRSIRFAIVAVVCVLFGAVTTVGVAWSCAFPLAIPSDESDLFDGDAADYVWPAWAQAPPGPVDWVRVLAVPGFRSEILMATRSPVAVEVMSCGWPLRALWCGRRLDVEPPPPASTIEFASWRGGIRLCSLRASWPGQTVWFSTGVARQRGTFEAYLPLMPLFPGLALDTGVYAAAWWVVIFAGAPLYRAARRRLRVSRGMCGYCGYDLRGSGSAVCPECGGSARMQA